VIGLARLLRACVRAIVVRGRRVGAVERALRFVLLSPPMLMWLGLRWLWLRRAIPLEDEAATDDGVRLNCRLADMIQMFVYLFGRWEPDLAAFLRSRLGPGDTFIDVGANVGAFALGAAKRVGRQGRVIAVEASPRIAARLRENISLNPKLVETIEVVHAAASEGEGTLTLYEGPAKNLGMTTPLAERGFRAEATVRAAPLEALVGRERLREAKAIKIDVEGGERSVLAGLARSIESLRAEVEIVVECSPHWWAVKQPGLREALQPFFDAGFRLYEVENNYWPWRYLWPDDVKRPWRFRGRLDGVDRRIELVLSRVDAEAL
jgi:FkbM family methyltransferase